MGKRVLFLILTVLLLSGCQRTPQAPAIPSQPWPAGEIPILEMQVPFLAGQRPAARTDIRVDDPQAMHLLEGMKPVAYIGLSSPAANTARGMVQEVMESGEGRVLRHGAWFEVWPQVLEIAHERLVLKLYYGRMGNYEGQWVAQWDLGFSPQEGTTLDPYGRFAVDVNALYVIPGGHGEKSWVAITAIGPPDERELNPYTFDTLGYSRCGTVVLVEMEASEGLNHLASVLAELKSAAPAPGWEAVYREGQDLERASRLEEASEKYLEAYMQAGFLGQHHPGLLFHMGNLNVRMGRDIHIGVLNILAASHLAEQQGETDLLREVDMALARLEPGELGYADLYRFVLQRRVELNPFDGDLWWELAERFLPAVDIAETVQPAEIGNKQAASLHLRIARGIIGEAAFMIRQSDEAIRSSGKELLKKAEASVDRALYLDSGNTYGIFLDGILQDAANEDLPAAIRSMKRVLEREPAQPDARRYLLLFEHRLKGISNEIARWNLSPSGEACTIGGQGVAWSGDGHRIAAVVHFWEPHWHQKLVITGGKTGNLKMADVDNVRLVGWSSDSNWLYIISHNSLKRVRWDLSEEVMLAPVAYSAMLSPDGNRTAFTDRGIWVLDNADGSVSQVTWGEQDQVLLWYPDSLYLVYAADTGKPAGDGAPNLQVLSRVPVDSPGEVDVIHSKEELYVRVEWLKPGHIWGVVSGWDDLFSVWSLDANGNVAELGGLEIGGYQFLLVPGRVLALTHPTYEITVLSVLDEKGNSVSETLVSGFPGYPPTAYLQAEASPCGSLVALTYSDDFSASTWVIDLETSEQYLVTTDPYVLVGWSPDGREMATFDGWNLIIHKTR